MSFQKTKFKKTELGEIPEEWSIVQIQEICKTSSGGTPSRSNPDYYKGNIPWIKTGELKDDYIYKTEESISADALRSSSAKLFPSETVLFAMYGATIGKTAITKISATTNQACCAFLPLKRDSVNPYFLQQYFIFVRPKIVSKGEGAGQPNTSQDFLKRYCIIYPPFYEQQKIASILSRVDELSQKTDQIIEQTKRLKKGLMQTLPTKGIRHTKFKKTELGEIPEEWSLEKLGNLLTSCQYGLSLSLSDKGMYPIFRMNNIKNGYMNTNDFKYIDLEQKVFEQYKLDKGDILINRTNSIDLVGKLGIFLLDGDYTFASYLIRMRTIKEKLDSFFLNFYLNTERMQYKLKRLATPGVSQANINATNLKSLIIPIPSLSEQKKITTVILNIDDNIKIFSKEKNTLKNLKKGLMQQLLTGKIRVKV